MTPSEIASGVLFNMTHLAPNQDLVEIAPSMPRDVWPIGVLSLLGILTEYHGHIYVFPHGAYRLAVCTERGSITLRRLPQTPKQKKKCSK